MPRRIRTSGLADSSAQRERNEMLASAVGSENRDGAIHVVAEGDDIVAICLDGEFDLANAPALRAEVEGALGSGHDVILDLTEATFIDSSLIGVLLQARKTAQTNARVVVLQLGTAAIVERALQVAEVEQVLPRAHDRSEAVRMARRRSDVASSDR
jgi:anti-sigma B factor antagonist